MAPYTYNTFYDPIGSQPSQPTGYTHANKTAQQQQQTSSSAPYPNQASSSYSTNYQQGYPSNYTVQQYGQASQQQPSSSSTDRAASALSSLSSPNYGRSTSETRSANNTAQYGNSYYSNPGFAAMNERSQSNNSPLYATNTPASTFGRLGLPEQPQTRSNDFASTPTLQSASSERSARAHQYASSSASQTPATYQDAYNQQQSQQPQQLPRYASPLHAVQAQQHGHAAQALRGADDARSPRTAVRNALEQGQQSAYADPSPTTVDPSQVYDMRAEQQRKAQIEAEKWRKLAAARKAEDDARAAEDAARVAEEHRKAEEERLQREVKEAQELAKKSEEDELKKREAQERKNEQRRKAREEKRKSKTAATTLAQMASGSGLDTLANMPGDCSHPPANADEEEMRAMFLKMRELNQRNPAMLAKLWEEERNQHTTKSPVPQPAKSVPSAPSMAQQQEPSVQPVPPQQYRPKPTPATQAPPPPSAPQQASNALWPPHKKGSLAAAAANWLNNLPENSSFDRSISKEDILKILDSNPSYVQLCESIEQTSVRFERSALAKELLKAVPDGLKNQQGSTQSASQASGMPSPASAAGPSREVAKNKGGRPRKSGLMDYGVPPNRGISNAGTVAYQAPSFQYASSATPEANYMGMAQSHSRSTPSVASAITASTPMPPSVPSPYSTDSHVPKRDSRSVSQPHAETQAGTPAQLEGTPRPPASKEEAARKRTFSDLIDLTKGDDSESDDDNDGPPRKVQQTFTGAVSEAMKYPPQSNSFGALMGFETFKRLNPTRSSMADQVSMPPPGPMQTNRTAFGHLEKPPAPPVQAPPKPVKPTGPSVEQKQHERMRGKMLVEPIMRDRVARKSRYDSRTIARDVLLATGRHPDMRALNAHFNPMQKLLGDHGGAVDGAGNKSDLSTIRWDVIDPDEPNGEAQVRKTTTEKNEDGVDIQDKSSASILHSEWKHCSEQQIQKFKGVASPAEWERIDEVKVRRLLANRLKQRGWLERRNRQKKAESHGEGGGITAHLPESEDDTGGGVLLSAEHVMRRGPGAKRRGRRPKIRDSNASPALLTTPASDTHSTARAHYTFVVNTPQSGDMSADGPVGYAAFRQYDADGNVVKKKGRPFGWRKDLHSRESKGLAPATGGGKAKATRYSVGAATQQAIVEPQYQVYECKWRSCTAELDNLDKLKKHVLKFHGTANDEDHFECQWQPCQFNGMDMDDQGKVRSTTDDATSFATLEQWMKHVDKEHFRKVAWRLGDGPKGGSVSDYSTDAASYLSDASGRNVTPVIVPVSEPDTSIDRVVQPALTSDIPEPHRLGVSQQSPAYEAKRAPKNKAERHAAAELEKLTQQKRREGLTMGREGSRLAIKKRRLGFLDDEDFEDIIYNSD